MKHDATHRARKRFGQNFLHDPGVIQRIITSVHAEPGQHLVEIGPGLGALTLPLLKAASELDVIELDHDVIPLLQQHCAGTGTLRVHNYDVLKFDFRALAADGRKLRVVGNLPYNISTPLLFHLMDQADVIQDLHVMVQKEVAERMAAGPGDDAYGRLSVMMAYHCAVQPLFTVGPGAFRPAPQVDSMVVRMTPHAEPPVSVRDATLLSEVVRRAFGQRRKTLRNALKELLTAEQIKAASVDPTLRPEVLSLADYARMANIISARDRI